MKCIAAWNNHHALANEIGQPSLVFLKESGT